MDGEADWDFTKVNAANEALEHTVLNMKFTDLQEMCFLADVVAPWSMKDVFEFALERVSITIFCGVSSNVALQHTGEVFGLQVV